MLVKGVRISGGASEVGAAAVFLNCRFFESKELRKSLFGRMGKMGVNFEKNCV
jgi:hypothetical protein